MLPQPLEVLTTEQIQEVHSTALRILEEVGLWLPNSDVHEILDGAGARVEQDSQVVRLPADLVDTCLELCPSSFEWPARRDEHTIALDGTYTHFTFPDSAVNIIDLAGKRRPGTAADGESICRLCDALPNMAVASTGITPQDMAPVALEAWHTLTSFSRSSKPVMAVCRSAQVSHQTLEMAKVVADGCHLVGDKLPLVAGMNPASPLFNTPKQLEGMMVYLRQGLPMQITPSVQAGATGPATLAGALVQQTAEFLGHAVLTQLVRPGTPILYGCVSSIFDMKRMMMPYGAPEADLLGIATVQIANHYGIPARTTGGSSDANALGMQAGVDSLMSILLSILSGASLVLHGGGELENTLAVSYEKIIIDNEIMSMARRIGQGILVTEDTLGFEAIAEVGPRGHFLATDHTLRHYKTEHFVPEIMIREKHDLWLAAGGKRAEERAQDRVSDLLAQHQPEPLPEQVRHELEAIYASARQSAAGRAPML